YLIVTLRGVKIPYTGVPGASRHTPPVSAAGSDRAAKKRPGGLAPGRSVRRRVCASSRLVHPSHATATARHRRSLLLLLLLHHDALGREEQAGDGCGVLQRRARDFRRVDNP